MITIPPQWLQALTKMAEDKKKEQNAELLKKTGDKAFGVLQGAGVLGNIMSATSNMPGQEPNVGQSSIGGALSGLSAGMAFGPIGAILGAGIGGVSGLISGGKNLEEHLLQLNQEQNANISSKTIQPTTFKPGGVVGQEGVQTEVGEIILLAGVMELVSSAANEEHKDMDSKLITDFFPKGSIVFSNKKMFDPKSIADKVIGYGQGHYEENKTYAPEQIKVGDIFGDKELTYADAAQKLKKSISVTDGKKKDIFDDITDAENKLTRMMYLKELIGSQEHLNSVNESAPVPQFEYGGTVGYVPKYTGGTPRGGVGSGVSVCPPGFFKAPDGRCVSAKELSGGVGTADSTNKEWTINKSSGDYYKDVLKKLTELRGTNQSELDKGKGDLSELSKKLRGSIMAQAGISTLFTALQNPITKPVVQGNTFIEDTYQQIPQSLIESQVSPIRGSVNSMAQMLLSSGADPSQVPAMLASSQGRALDAEGRMRSGFIEDRVNMDRGKYQALRTNLTTNNSNIVAADNATTEGYNQRFGQFGSILADMMGSNRELTAGKYEAGRNLDKSFFNNDINLFKTETDIAGNRMQFDDSMSRINERLAQLREHSSRINSEIDKRQMFSNKFGAYENGLSFINEVPDIMNFLPSILRQSKPPWR